MASTQKTLAVSLQENQRIIPLLDHKNIEALDFDFLEKMLSQINCHKKAIISTDNELSESETQKAETRKAYFREVRQIANSLHCQFIGIDSCAFANVSSHKKSRVDQCLVFAYLPCGQFCILQAKHVHIYNASKFKHFSVPVGMKMKTKADFQSYLKKKPEASLAFVKMIYSVSEFSEIFLRNPEYFINKNIGLELPVN